MASLLHQTKIPTNYIPSEKDPRCPLCGDFLEWKASKPTGKMGGAYFVICDHSLYPQYEIVGKNCKFFAKQGFFVEEFKAFGIKERNIKRKLESMTPSEIRDELAAIKRSRNDNDSSVLDQLKELKAGMQFVLKRLDALETATAVTPELSK